MEHLCELVGFWKLEMTVEIEGTAVIDDTPKVSFDDLVSGSIGSQDDDFSIQGLVSVPEDFEDIHSEPLPVLPVVPTTPPTPDLRSCFEPPQNPENMRKRPAYRTITPAPDYESLYSGYDWRTSTYVNGNSSNKRHRIYDNHFTSISGRSNTRTDARYSEEHQLHNFITLLRRIASCARRSLESRSAIVQQKEEFKDCMDPDNKDGELLINQTRSKILGMVRKELDHVNRKAAVATIVIDDSEEESTSSY